MINYNITPVYNPRIISQGTNSLSQLSMFTNVYRGLRDFIDNGGLNNLSGFSPNDIARWNSEFRPGVIWIGGVPSDINFFEDLWGGGEPKEIGASDLYVEYNSAVNHNIFAENSATGTSGTITGGCYYGSVSNGNYTGNYAVFSPATSLYTNGGTQCNVNVGDELFIYGDGRWVKVIKIDTTSNYAWNVYVAPKNGSYTINIPAKQSMLPVHVQEVTGYYDGSAGQISYHSEYETPGYVKKVQPLALLRSYVTPKNLGRAWQDKVTFPIIFDMVTGQMLDSWDLKATQNAREDMVVATTLKFFTGEETNNPALLSGNYTDQYNGFEGYMNELWYGGGQIFSFDPSIGFDLDVDYKALALQNDAQKLSREYLMLCAKAFKWSMESRAQDMFQNNSGAYSFETFRRGVLDVSVSTDIKRLGINSLSWGLDSLFIKEVSAWSDNRFIGASNGPFPNTGIAMPGYGQIDSNGMPTPPVEFWKPVGATQNAGWDEFIVDMARTGLQRDEYQGTITNTIQMSVNGIENVIGIFPNQ